MTDSTGQTSSMAQLLALLSGGSQGAQQYPVQQGLASPGFVGPMNQTMQAPPANLPPNVMALWASMTPELRAQWLAANMGRQPADPRTTQLASLAPPPRAPGTPLSLTPDLLARFAALQPQAQYGNPMMMRGPYMDQMEAWKRRLDGYQGTAQGSTEQ